MLHKIFHVGIFALIQFLCSIITNYYITKILSPGEYGNYFLVIATTQLVATIISLGATSSIVRFGQEMIPSGKLTSLMQNILGYILLLVIILSSIALLNIDLVSRIIFSIESRYLVYLLILQLPLVIITQFSTSLFWSYNDFIKKGISQVVFFVIQSLLVILIYFLDKDMKFDKIIWIILISRLINFIYCELTTKKIYGFSFLIKPTFNLKINNETSDFLKFGFWSSLSTISLLLIDFIDRIAIKSYLTSDNLGYYQSILSIFSYLYMPFQLLSNVFLSYFLKDWERDKCYVIKKIEQSTQLAIILFMVIASLFLVYYEVIITKFYGSNYLGVDKFVIIFFVFVFFFKIIYSITGCLSFISNKPKMLGVSMFSSLIISTILDFKLVPIYGLQGVLISSLITQVFLLGSLYYQFYKHGIKFSYLYYFSIITVFLIFIFFNGKT